MLRIYDGTSESLDNVSSKKFSPKVNALLVWSNIISLWDIDIYHLKLSMMFRGSEMKREMPYMHV